MVKTRILLLSAATAAVLTLPAAALAATKLNAVLNGASETAGGDPDGSGKFSAEVEPDSGDFCFTLSVARLDAPTAAHVHSGKAGTDGPPVVTVQVTGNGTDECVAIDPEKLKAIVAAPGDYYVNVHTAAFPNGAIRGQLAK